MKWKLHETMKNTYILRLPEFGIKLVVRPGYDEGHGSIAEAWIGQKDHMFAAAMWNSSEPWDSAAARINAFRAFKIWYGSVMAVTEMTWLETEEGWNKE